jgi:hypothetical protein
LISSIVQQPRKPIMTPETRLSDLLQDWLSLHQQGLDVPAAELCRDCPDLATPLSERIAVLRKMSALLRQGADIRAPQSTPDVPTAVPTSP